MIGPIERPREKNEMGEIARVVLSWSLRCVSKILATYKGFAKHLIQSATLDQNLEVERLVSHDE